MWPVLSKVVWVTGSLFYFMFFMLMGIDFNSKSERFQNVYALLLLLFLLITIITPVLFFTVDPGLEWKEVSSWKLCSLEDNLSVEGRYIQSGTKYHYRLPYKGGTKAFSLNSNKGYIVEKDTCDPRMYKMAEKPTKNLWFWGEGFEGEIEYKFVVPVGSVETDYNADLE